MVVFKLTKLDGLTRRITFTTLPTWSILSARIASLYDIAIDNVGVSYIDFDGDEVTLSSDDELQDFYTSVVVSGGIKLAVHDLSCLRATTAPRPLSGTTPQQSHFRNTFGGHEVLPLVFDTDDEWQRLPGSLGSLFLSKDAPDSPHAFVEVLESDVSVSKSEATESGGGDVTHSDLASNAATVQDKGKGKGRAATIEDDVSSADSVIGDESPAKPPVHVFDVRSEGIFGLPHASTARSSQSGVATPAQAQSTPVISEQTLKAHESEEPKTEGSDDDPPLPSLDLPDPHRISPSLVRDVTSLLTTITTVLSAHPELSENLRNIVVNTSNGTYLAAHRDAISRAAQEFHRTAIEETGRSFEELRRTTEQEASTRFTEALGRIFRTVGDFGRDEQENTNAQTSRDTAPVFTDESAPNPPSSTSVPSFPRFSHLPPHPRRNHHLWFTPPPFAHPTGPSWVTHPPPPPPPPPPILHPRNWPRPPPRFWARGAEHQESVESGVGTRAAFADDVARAAEERGQSTAAQSSSALEVTSEELRADVEKAKADYKARKERYRQAKATRKMAEQRRHDRESTSESLSRQTSDNPVQITPDKEPSNNTTPTPEQQAAESSAATSGVHIVSNARGRYPQLEMFSVPKRGHATGHMHRGHVHENKENRPLNRIMRKLSDMGFTEGTYPNLTKKVMDQLLLHPSANKDAEDDIVTNLIEELIPSGGGAQTGGGIPGAWN